jgi:hypothetical protein
MHAGLDRGRCEVAPPSLRASSCFHSRCLPVCCPRDVAAHRSGRASEEPMLAIDHPRAHGHASDLSWQCTNADQDIFFVAGRLGGGRGAENLRTRRSGTPYETRLDLVGTDGVFRPCRLSRQRRRSSSEGELHTVINLRRVNISGQSNGFLCPCILESNMPRSSFSSSS